MLLAVRAREILSTVVATVREAVGRLLRGVVRSPALALAALLAFLLALSLLVYAAEGTARVRRVLFFPDPVSGKLVGEEHFIPRARGGEQSARELVRELLLGPSAYDLAPVLPRTVGLRSLTVEDRIAYVDLSADLVIDAATVPLTLDKVLQAVANNLYFNFPRLRGVYLFIHGQIPTLEGIDASRLAYSRDMVR